MPLYDQAAKASLEWTDFFLLRLLLLHFPVFLFPFLCWSLLYFPHSLHPLWKPQCYGKPNCSHKLSINVDSVYYGKPYNTLQVISFLVSYFFWNSIHLNGYYKIHRYLQLPLPSHNINLSYIFLCLYPLKLIASESFPSHLSLSLNLISLLALRNRLKRSRSFN